MGNKQINATVPEQTVEWLRDQYPDAKSDSERIAMAISDARKLDRLISARRVSEIRID